MSDINISVTLDKGEIIKQAIIDNANKIIQNAIIKTMPKLINEVELIVKTAIDDYYDSYVPHIYKRTESLYSIFDIEYTKNGFNIIFDEGKMNNNHRADDDYIYDVMFKKGYHGGAPYNGDYYWRYPSPQLAQELHISPFISWYPWGPAPQSESPWNRIQLEWNRYSNGDGKKLVLDAIKKEIQKVVKEVS